MFDVSSLTNSGGILGILILALIIFAESGLLVGFFLPGDSLLFAAGLAASQGRFSIVALILAVVIAAIVGDNVGYSIGRRAGPRIFRKRDGVIFRHEYLQQSEKFYEQHGGKTIILARFTPIVRTFAPVVAGASKMPRRKFMFYNIFGAVLWGAGIPALGYFVGNRVPDYWHHVLEAVIVGIVLFSIGIAVFHVLREKQSRTRIAAKLKQLFRSVMLNKKVD